MVKITLPDGSIRSYEHAVTPLEIAESISNRLKKEAFVAKVNGTLVDIYFSIEQDASVEILTKKNNEVLELIRHDTAHVMAEAVKELYPETEVTIGPAIENGFYYDFYREKPFTEEDFSQIEERMREIIDRNEPILREEWKRDDAIELFRSMGENYKVELIEAIPQGEIISLYRQGDFIDLCRGPHAPSTSHIGKAFKLMKVAGAYWRGDSRNVMLQRIYGTAWTTEKQLKEYLTQLEEAAKRDHRKLGKEMNLFHMQEEAIGSVFWHPKGWSIYQTLRSFIRKKLIGAGYQEVNTPILVDRKLWEASGHWEKFQENMFTIQADEKSTLAVKPMNCPCHIQIFNKGQKSYRDLPLRLAEFGCCFRNEASGAIHGLMRVRNFVQDDAHIFCTPEQIITECKDFCALLLSVYKDLGFEDVHIKFSDRPEKRAGSPEIWDKAEKSLKEAIDSTGLEWSLNPGEGAFYGPKLEFVLRDAIGREWQCGTLQLDFVMPERLGASYIGESGEKHTPVMLHRAILGSFERFIGILIEHYEGRFPLWLAPTQVVIASITTDVNPFAEKLCADLKKEGIRADLDLRNEKINFKIREHSLLKIPLIFVVGKREAEEGTVAIRRLGSKDQEVLHFDEALIKLKKEASGPLI